MSLNLNPFINTALALREIAAKSNVGYLTHAANVLDESVRLLQTPPQLYRWRSNYLANCGLGHIIVQATTPDEARAIVRKAFEARVSEDYAWADGTLPDWVVEEVAEERAKLEADLKLEPEILPGFIFIGGSE